MIDFILNLDHKVDLESLYDYRDCVGELFESEAVHSMKNFVQHGSCSCFDHSVSVSYYSFLICKQFGFDYQSAARGGLLHDFFLYDWRTTTDREGLHGFSHPRAALKNADHYFDLNDVERDIIVKHMWPMTVKMPKYRESYVVSAVDKYCAVGELIHVKSSIKTAYDQLF